MELAKIPQPNLPTYLIYKPTSIYLREDLPCFPGNSGRLELCLLPGDLGDESKLSDVAVKVLQHLESNEKSPDINPLFLLAGQGFGKTKTLYDIAQHHFTIFVDPSKRESQRDIDEMIIEINKLVERFASQSVLFTISMLIKV